MAVTARKSKVCTACRQRKPVAKFHLAGNTVDGRHTLCAECKNKRASGYYKRWTPEQREKHRARVHRARYGIELDVIQSLYEQQEGCCAVCGSPGDRPAVNEKRKSSKGVLCIDHDHKTGVVRGLLCRNCNLGIGKLGDSVELLVRAANYMLKEGGL